MLAPSGAPLAGVTVTLAGQTSVTDAKGDYQLQNVTPAASDTIAYSSASFESDYRPPFTPPSSTAQALPDVKMQVIGSVDKPRIKSISSDHEGIFIAGVPLPNTYYVWVNWNGLTPSYVDFYVNNTNSIPIHSTNRWNFIGGSGIWTEIDMGQRFAGSLTPGANKLIAVAGD